jgi:hypothetical protein
MNYTKIHFLISVFFYKKMHLDKDAGVIFFTNADVWEGCDDLYFFRYVGLGYLENRY